MSLASTITGIFVATAITFGSVATGIVGQGVLAEQHAAQVAAWQAAIEADAARDAAAFAEFAAADASFRGNAIATASALIESAQGKASEDAIQALRDAIALYVIPDNNPRGTALVQAQKHAERTAGVAIQSATEIVAVEVSAWQAAEDARIAAEAARQAEAQRSSPNGSSGDTSSSNSNSSSNVSSSSSSSPSGDGRAWAEGVVQSVAPGASVVWGYSGAGRWSGMYKSGVVYLSDSIADQSSEAYAIAVHEAAHHVQRNACADVYMDHFWGDGERFAQAWTVAHFGTVVGAYPYPSQEDINVAATCG